MRTYTAIILSAREGFVNVELPCGSRVELKAGADVEAQAERMTGRSVRFQALLHESTLSLASPIFVIGSQHGLKAVADAAVRPTQAEAEAAE